MPWCFWLSQHWQKIPILMVENLMYHAKQCERRHSRSNMIAQTCLCSFTLSPLRQMGISEEGLSLFWTIAAILVGELQSFC